MANANWDTRYENAWKIGNTHILHIQSSDGCWDYTLYTSGWDDDDGGQIDDTCSTIEEIRDSILEDYSTGNHPLKEYDLMHQPVVEMTEEEFEDGLYGAG